MNKYLTLIPIALLTFGCLHTSSQPTVTVSPTLETVANNTIVPQTIAREITVRIQAGTRRGSGTIIAKRGNRYTILTNSHVANKANTYQITTPDGKTYPATCAQPLKQGTCTADKNHDLALLEFTSTQKYTFPTWGDSRSLKPGEAVYSAGFPFEGRELKIDKSQVTQQTSKPLQGGYQIGFSGTTAQGMSGGSLLNSSGQLIGIIGFNSQPILNDGYQYQDGTQPLPDVVKDWRKSSFAIPIATLAQLDRQYQAFLPSGSSTAAYTGVVKQVDEIAAQITVRIEDKNGGNGSGVIIAKDGDTYYVATAAHVVQSIKKENGRGVLGEKIAATLISPTQERIALSEGEINVVNPDLDLAIVKFKSQQNYRVAEIGKYEFFKSDWVFVSGFPGKDASKRRRLSIGIVQDRETTQFASKDRSSLIDGRNLVYTNLSLPGMSGGAVLDRAGKLVGINTGAENQEILSTGEQINYGYALGIPTSTLLGFVSQAQLPATKLQIKTSPGADVAQVENAEIHRIQLSALSQPSSKNATAKEWLDYGNLLWRGGKSPEAVVVFDRAIDLLNSNPKIDDFKEHLTIAYLGKGLALGSQSKNLEALKSFERATQIDDGSYPAWRYKGQFLGLLGSYKEALLAYQKAIQIDRDNKYTLSMEQIFYIFMPSGGYSEAIAYVDEAISEKPNLLFPHWVKSNLYLSLQDFDKAFASANRAIEINPNFGNVYQQRSIIYYLRKDYDNALKDINKAIELDPNNADIYTNRADLYKNRNRFDLALADYNRAIELNTKNPNAYYQRGKFYQARKNEQKAAADFNAAIGLIETVSAIDYVNRSHIYTSMKQEQKAIADLDAAIRLNPNNAIAYNTRAITLLGQNREQEGLKDLDRAIEINPNYESSYVIRGQLFQGRQELDKALSDFNRAIEINTNNSTAFASRGMIFQSRREYQKALTDFNKAIAIDNNYLGYVGRGLVLIAQGNYSAALTDLNTAIDIDIDGDSYKFNKAAAYIARGQLFQSQGKFQEALNDFNLGIELDPNEAANYLTRSAYFLLQGDFTKALADCDLAIKHSTSKSSISQDIDSISQAIASGAYAQKATIFQLQAEKTQDSTAKSALSARALVELERAIKIKPNNDSAYVLMGQIFSYQAKYDRAMESYNKAISIGGNALYIYYAYLGRAKIFNLRGNYQQAIDDATKFIDTIEPSGALSPQIKSQKLIEGHIVRGQSYLQAKNYDRAISDYTKAIAIDDKNLAAYIGRADVYAFQKQYQNAIDDYDRAIKLDPKLTAAYRNRGYVYAQQQEYTKAIASLNQAIDLNSQDPTAYKNRGDVYAKTGRYSEARADLQKAAELFRAQKNLAGEQEVQSELQKLTK
jgi:tetratricopeptide (TPR) repeat protein